jgi:hypothetical protein
MSEKIFSNSLGLGDGDALVSKVPSHLPFFPPEIAEHLLSRIKDMMPQSDPVGLTDEIPVSAALAWIIHDLTGEKRKDALKGVMNTGFWRTRHSLSEHPRDDILLYTTAVLFLLPTPTHSS